jgi:hypothetical protein
MGSVEGCGLEGVIWGGCERIQLSKYQSDLGSVMLRCS